MAIKKLIRCNWCGEDPLYTAYHDQEWGVPLYDDNRLFELLILEGMQAGLSWLTVLKKRENFRQAFAGFNPEKIARFNKNTIEKLMLNSGIIRNRRKIESTIKNAQAFIQLKQEQEFKQFLWKFVEDKPLLNRWRHQSAVPAKNAISDQLSKELKRKGFSFVGSTICYAFMQAVGMINDHLLDCYRYEEIKKKSGRT